MVVETALEDGCTLEVGSIAVANRLIELQDRFEAALVAFVDIRANARDVYGCIT